MRTLFIVCSVLFFELWSISVHAVPEYDEVELSKLRNFLNQESAERGVRNFEQLGLSSLTNINWASVPGLQFNSVTLKLEMIRWQSRKLSGNLDLSDFLELKYLYLQFNELKSINLKNSSALVWADLYTNDLFSLDVTTNPLLEYLRLGYNNISVLDLSNNKTLGFLCCTSNRFKILEVTDNNYLRTILCIGNLLHTLIVENCEELETLHCDFNYLTSLNLHNLPNLQSFSCTANILTELSFHNCLSLDEVLCYDNEINSLDFSSLKQLTSVACERNQITSINFAGCENLTTLSCDNNLLDKLDISSSPNLSTLSCKYNNLSFLTLPYRTPQLTNYSYMPQNYVAIECDHDAIDLSDLYNIHDNISSYFWYYMNVLVTPLASNEGRFAFDESYIGKTFVCRVRNSILPELTMHYDVTFTNETGARSPEATGLSIYASEKKIHVSVESSALVSIYSLQGELKSKRMVDAGHTVFPAESGAYLVVINDRASYKVIVR